MQVLLGRPGEPDGVFLGMQYLSVGVLCAYQSWLEADMQRQTTFCHFASQAQNTGCLNLQQRLMNIP